MLYHVLCIFSKELLSLVFPRSEFIVIANRIFFQVKGMSINMFLLRQIKRPDMQIHLNRRQPFE